MANGGSQTVGGILKSVLDKLMNEGYIDPEEEQEKLEQEKKKKEEERKRIEEGGEAIPEEEKAAEPTPTTEEQVKQGMDDLYKNDMDDIDDLVENDLKEMQATLQYADEVSAPFVPAPSIVNIKNALTRLFSRLRKEMQVRYLREQTSGKLSIPSVIKEMKRAAPTGRIWQKRIAPSKKAVQMGIAILIDESGSMATEYLVEGVRKPAIGIARDTAWAISTAIEEDNGYACVLGFSPATDVFLRKDFRKQGNFTQFFGGGTTINPSLLLAVKKLNELYRTKNIDNLLLVIVTDGEFGDVPSMTQQVRNRKGDLVTIHISTLVRSTLISIRHSTVIRTVLIYINGARPMPKYPVDYAIDLTDFAQLPQQLAKVIEQLQKEKTRVAIKRAGG